MNGYEKISAIIKMLWNKKHQEENMSGSGGGGGFGGFSDSKTSCESLIIETHLSSPKEQVVNNLEVGAILDVQIQGETQPVVVCLFNGQVAGGIASLNVHRLRECIESGTHYAAEVKEKNEGQVRVLIRAVQQ